MLPTKPTPTREEEIIAYMFRSGTTGRGKAQQELTRRMLELLADLVASGHDTFADIFQHVWALKPEKHGRSEEYTRLRVYELLQKACVAGLLEKEERLYRLGPQRV